MRLFAKGDRVTHPQYGHGTISSTDEQYTEIDFDEHGPKKFITNMVSLEPTNEPAPAAPARAKRARKSRAAAKRDAEGKADAADKANKPARSAKSPKSAKTAKAAKAAKPAPAD